MASSTIDPLIRIKPSENLLRVVTRLYEAENSDLIDAKETLPAGISSFLECSENSYSDLTFTIDDIKWIYKKKPLLNSLAMNQSINDETQMIR